MAAACVGYDVAANFKGLLVSDVCHRRRKVRPPDVQYLASDKFHSRNYPALVVRAFAAHFKAADRCYVECLISFKNAVNINARVYSSEGIGNAPSPYGSIYLRELAWVIKADYARTVGGDIAQDQPFVKAVVQLSNIALHIIGRVFGNISPADAGICESVVECGVPVLEPSALAADKIAKLIIGAVVGNIACHDDARLYAVTCHGHYLGNVARLADKHNGQAYLKPLAAFFCSLIRLGMLHGACAVAALEISLEAVGDIAADDSLVKA